MTWKPSRFWLFALLSMLCFVSEGFWVTPSAEAARGRAAVNQADEEAEEMEEDADAETGNDASDEEADEEEEEEEEEEFDPDAPLAEPIKLSGEVLKTKDSVLLSATFYPGNRGKKSVPVIILHDWGGTRADVKVLAEALQEMGCAVLIPDLRGHGKSNRLKIGPEETEKFEAKKKIRYSDFEEVVIYDLPCLKKYLMQQHKAGKLNIDKLCVGGVGFGGQMCAFFANADWNPMIKRNKENPMMGDVKAFFIVSPLQGLKGVNFKDAITYPTWAECISCIVLSSGTKDGKTVKFLETQVKKTCSKDALKRCWFKNYDGKGEGAELIQDPDSDFVLDILAFVELRCIKRDILWKNR